MPRSTLPTVADHLADLEVVVQERDELVPGVGPQPDDRRVPLPPRFGELVERHPCGLSVDGGVDGLDAALEGVPVPPRGQAEGIADQADDAGLDDRLREYV